MNQGEWNDNKFDNSNQILEREFSDNLLLHPKPKLRSASLPGHVTKTLFLHSPRQDRQRDHR